MSKIGVYLFSLFLLFLVLSGCARDFAQDNQSQFIPAADNLKSARLQKFNDEIKKISDESSARSTISDFTNYAQSRISKKSRFKNSRRLFALSDDLLSRLAKIEADKRMAKPKGLLIKDVGPEITVDKVADVVNSLSETSQEVVSAGFVSAVQNEVREQIPDIAPDSSEEMTPLEAMVVGYAMFSGDDGSADVDSVNLNVPPDKTEAFMQGIVE